MKRLLTIGLMLVSAFALTNCAEEIAAPVQDDITVDGNIENITPPEEEVNIPFEVFATVGGEAETKTQNIGNGTYWICEDDKKDQISVFHYNHESAKSTAISKMTHNKPFTIKDVKGIFEGGLSNTLGDTNDWYFLYPYGENYTIIEDSSSGSTLTVSGVQIGAQTINQDLINTIDKNITLAANSKAYICDKLSPMFGHLPNRPRNEQPEIGMNHLAAIVAIKIVNKGDGGDIVISSIEFNAPEAIVGTFNVKFNDEDNVSFEASTATTTARVELPSPTRIEYGKYITIYVPIKPFDASGKEITIAINGTAVKNNGVSRSVTMPANTKLQAGKVTTFTVSVNELSFHHKDVRPETSNVLDEEGTIFVKNGWKYEVTTGKLGVLSHPTPQPLIINGLPVNGYILGSESDCGHVTIRGTARELITYVPLEFYASSWNDTKAVMRVESITAYFEAIRTPVTFTYDNLYPSIIADKTKITFSGLLSLMQVFYDNKKHIVILDEEPYHKSVSIKKIEDLLQSFDDNKADNEQGKKPTYEGLKGALQNPSSLPSSSSPDLSSLTKQSDITATIVYLKLKEKLSSNILLKLVSALLFRSPKSMFEMAADMPLEVKLSTVSKGTEGATDNRIVVWGLNSPNAND